MAPSNQIITDTEQLAKPNRLKMQVLLYCYLINGHFTCHLHFPTSASCLLHLQHICSSKETSKSLSSRCLMLQRRRDDAGESKCALQILFSSWPGPFEFLNILIKNKLGRKGGGFTLGLQA